MIHIAQPTCTRYVSIQHAFPFSLNHFSTASTNHQNINTLRHSAALFNQFYYTICGLEILKNMYSYTPPKRLERSVLHSVHFNLRPLKYSHHVLIGAGPQSWISRTIKITERSYRFFPQMKNIKTISSAIWFLVTPWTVRSTSSKFKQNSDHTALFENDVSCLEVTFPL